MTMKNQQIPSDITLLNSTTMPLRWMSTGLITALLCLTLTLGMNLITWEQMAKLQHAGAQISTTASLATQPSQATPLLKD